MLPSLLRRDSSASLPALAAAWLRPVALGALAALRNLLLVGRLVEIETLVEFVGVGLLWLAAYGALVWRFALRDPERRTITEAFGRGSTAVAPADEPLL